MGVMILLICLSFSFAAAGAGLHFHSIRSGDTLWKIARDYDVDLLKLLDLNPCLTPDNLKVGQRINLPEPLYSYHVIQPGDNVHSLAAQYRVPLRALLETNQIANEKVVVGETIRIPIHLYQEEQKPNTHLVEIGDTLFQLALKYKVGLTQLAQRNNIEDLNRIVAGQTLIIP